MEVDPLDEAWVISRDSREEVNKAYSDHETVRISGIELVFRLKRIFLLVHDNAGVVSDHQMLELYYRI